MSKLFIKGLLNLVIFGLTLQVLNGQPIYEKKYASSTPNEEALFATAGLSGSLIICGRTYSSPSDGIIMNTNNSGSIIWAKKIEGTGDEVINKIRPTSDGNYIATGFTTSYGAGGKDLLLMKLDANGNILWSKTFGTVKNEIGWDVRQTTDGGYIIIGEFGKSTSTLEGSIYLLKTNNVGVETWSKKWGAGMGNDGQRIVLTSDGGYLLGVQVNNGFQGLIKTNSLGTILWSRNNRAIYLQYVGANDMKVLSNGNIVLVGSGDNFSNNESVTVAMLDSVGRVKWWKIYDGGTNPDRGLGVEEGSGGNLLVTAYTNSYPTFQNLLLMQIDKTTGTLISAKTSSNIDYRGLNLSRSSDNAYIGAGTYNNSIYVTKMDGNGRTGCTQPTVSPTVTTMTYYDTTLTWSANSTAAISNSPTLTTSNLIFTVTTICSGVGIGEKSTASMLNIFPNPANSFVNVELPEQLNTDHFKVEIYNTLGTLVNNGYYKSTDRLFRLCTQSLNHGIYIIRFEFDDKIFSKKILIER